MKPAQLIPTLLILLIGFGGGLWIGRSSYQISPWTINRVAEVKVESSPIAARGQATIVPKSGLVNVMVPPGQRLLDVMVNEGDSVTAGKTELAKLLGQVTLELQTQLVDSQMEDAQRELNQKILVAESNKLNADSSLSVAQSQLKQAQDGIELALAERQLVSLKKKLDSINELADDPKTELYVSKSVVDDQKLAIEQAESKLIFAKQQQANAIEAAKLNVESAKKASQQAETVLRSLNELRDQNRTFTLTKQIAENQAENARLIAPIDGTIVRVFGKKGDVLVNSPLLQVADLSEMYCTAEIVDQLVSKLFISQSVVIKSPALPKDLAGTVVEIGRVVGNASLTPTNPLEPVDRKTVQVRIKINEEDNEIAKKLVNLQVDLDFVDKRGAESQLNKSAQTVTSANSTVEK